MSLRWRLAAGFAGVALAVGVVVAVASYLGTGAQLRDQVDQTLRTRAAAAQSVIGAVDADGGARAGHRRGDGPGGGPAAAAGPPAGDCPLPGEFAPATAAQLVSPSGVVTPCIDGAPLLPFTTADLTAQAVSVRTVTVDGRPFRVLSTQSGGGSQLEVGRSLADVDVVLGRLRLQLVVLVVGAAALAALAGLGLAARLVRPIVRLRDATRRIASTLDLSTPVDVDAVGEVGSLATSFTAMVTALGRSREQQRRLVSDAGHEMRTPLTSLRSNVELLANVDRLPPSERSEVIADVLADVDELTTLLAEVVVLASDLSTAEPEEAVDLGDLARVVAARTERRTGRTVGVDDRGVRVVGRPRQLERAIANLVENACKYSSPDAPVEVVVDGASVVVHDRGPGIAPGDLPLVFERFYRSASARSAPGSGLGLAIVAEIARTHGGAASAANRTGGGASVGFHLPPSRELHTPAGP